MDYHFKYQDKEYVTDQNFYNYLKIHGCSEERCNELLAESIQKNIFINMSYIKDLCSSEHNGIGNRFIDNYSFLGNLNMPLTIFQATKDKLSEEFKNDSRFHGRVPKIIDSICAVYDFFSLHKIPAENLVTDFNIQTVKKLLDEKIPSVQAVLLYQRYSIEQCKDVASNRDLVAAICNLLVKGIRKGNINLLESADWIMNHRNSNKDFLNKIIKNIKNLDLTENTTIDSAKAQLASLKSLKEIDKIEKAYKKPGFKFSECTCELKDVNYIISDDNYNAYIMDAKDPRQVILGYATNCCQHLGDAGESSMMHGLLNPKAGFFIIEDKNTKEIKAQAEIWEENDNTLVFDNIEYANDCDIDLYKNILTKWLQKTTYPNVKMGTGYNELSNGQEFRFCEEAPKPTITAREAYVMSYEDEIEIPNNNSELEELESEEIAQKYIDSGEITYFTYLYCDSEINAVWLKENGILEPYFTPSLRILNLKGFDVSNGLSFNINLCIDRENDLNLDNQETLALNNDDSVFELDDFT